MVLFQEFSAWKVLSSTCSLLVAPGLLKLMCCVWAHCSWYLWTPLADDLIKCSYWTISDQLLKTEFGGGAGRADPHRQSDLVDSRVTERKVCLSHLCQCICQMTIGFHVQILHTVIFFFFGPWRKAEFYSKLNKKTAVISFWNLKIHLCGWICCLDHGWAFYMVYSPVEPHVSQVTA